LKKLISQLQWNIGQGTAAWGHAELPAKQASTKISNRYEATFSSSGDNGPAEPRR